MDNWNFENSGSFEKQDKEVSICDLLVEKDVDNLDNGTAAIKKEVEVAIIGKCSA